MPPSHGRNAEPLGNSGPGESGTFQLCVSGRVPGEGARAAGRPPSTGRRARAPVRLARWMCGSQRVDFLPRPASSSPLQASPSGVTLCSQIGPRCSHTQPVFLGDTEAPGLGALESPQCTEEGQRPAQARSRLGRGRGPTLSQPSARMLRCPGGPRWHRSFRSCWKLFPQAAVVRLSASGLMAERWFSGGLIQPKEVPGPLQQLLTGVLLRTASPLDRRAPELGGQPPAPSSATLVALGVCVGVYVCDVCWVWR